MSEIGEGIIDRISRKPYKEILIPGRYQLRVTNGYEGVLPSAFYDAPFDFIQGSGKIIKAGANKQGKYLDTEVREILMPDGSGVISKRFLPDKMGWGRDTKEYDILTRAWQAGLPGAIPIATIAGVELTDGSYLLMSELPGKPGRFIDKKLLASGMTHEEIEKILKQIHDLYALVIEQYRKKIGIDKREWHTKDTMLEISSEEKEVKALTPIDFEWAVPYSPKRPGRIVIDRTI